MSACNEILYLFSKQVLFQKKIYVYTRLGNNFHLELGHLSLEETFKAAYLLSISSCCPLNNTNNHYSCDC